MEREQTTIRLPAEEGIKSPEEDFKSINEERIWTGTIDLPEGCRVLKNSFNAK